MTPRICSAAASAARALHPAWNVVFFSLFCGFCLLVCLVSFHYFVLLLFFFFSYHFFFFFHFFSYHLSSPFPFFLFVFLSLFFLSFSFLCSLFFSFSIYFSSLSFFSALSFFVKRDANDSATRPPRGACGRPQNLHSAQLLQKAQDNG